MSDGAVDKAKGRVKEAAGDLTDDRNDCLAGRWVCPPRPVLVPPGRGRPGPVDH
jgi:hypothetical protein